MEYEEICTYILAGVFGLCFGSFANVLIYRLPRGMNIAKPPSHCTSCGYQLKWYDNIPVLSYLILRGKCRKCGEHISLRYTIVEVFVCVMWVLCAVCFYDEGYAVIIAYCVAVTALTVAFFTDLEQLMVPDSMTIGIALAALAVLIAGLCGCPTQVDWKEQLIGLAFGFGFFALFYFGFLLIRKREGLGFGDVKLMGAIGFLLGWKSCLLCIILSCLLALIVHPIALFLSGRSEKKLQTSREGGEEGQEEQGAPQNTGEEGQETREETDLEEEKEERKAGEFPFAPFLSAAAVICLFVGNAFCDFYMGLFL